jgi:hypothetical protein
MSVAELRICIISSRIKNQWTCSSIAKKHSTIYGSSSIKKPFLFFGLKRNPRKLNLFIKSQAKPNP